MLLDGILTILQIDLVHSWELNTHLFNAVFNAHAYKHVLISITETYRQVLNALEILWVEQDDKPIFSPTLLLSCFAQNCTSVVFR